MDSLKLRNEKLLREKDDYNKENEKLKAENDYYESKIDSLNEENKSEKLKQKIGDYSSEIYFFGDSDKLREYSEKELNKIVGILSKYPNLKININGYVNGYDPIKNPNLDQKRADRAKQLLVSKGISSNRVKAIGKGINHIVNEDEYVTDKEGKRYNRNMRAIIKIYED